MKRFIYRTIVQREQELHDIDRIPYWDYTTIKEELFATKTDAIRFAQKQFAKRFYNRYIRSWYVEVRRAELTRNGAKQFKRIYRLYDTNKGSIY